MSDKRYFEDLIRKMKELRVSGSGEIIVNDDDSIKFVDTQIPFIHNDFAKLSSEQKEALFIWLNKDNIPQA